MNRQVSRLAESLTAVALVGVGSTLLWKGMGKAIRLVRRHDGHERKEWQFNGAFPRGSGAISAVTGGDPEDMNAMPTTQDPHQEGPIYDGSDLSGA